MKAVVEPVTIIVRERTLVGAGKVIEERQEFAVICDDTSCHGHMQAGFEAKADAAEAADAHNETYHADE